MTQLLSSNFQRGESALKEKASGNGCIGVGIISYNSTSLKTKRPKHFAEDAVKGRLDNCAYTGATVR